MTLAEIISGIQATPASTYVALSGLIHGTPTTVSTVTNPAGATTTTAMAAGPSNPAQAQITPLSQQFGNAVGGNNGLLYLMGVAAIGVVAFIAMKK